MKKYSGYVVYSATKYIEVEAEDWDAAETKMMEDMPYVCLCHSCANELDVGEPYEVVDIQEIE